MEQIARRVAFEQYTLALCQRPPTRQQHAERRAVVGLADSHTPLKVGCQVVSNLLRLAVVEQTLQTMLSETFEFRLARR